MKTADKPDESPYDPEYVKMVLQGDKDLKEGKGEKITIEDLEIISNLERGFKEMRLLKKGKLKTTSLNSFLNEL